MNENSGGKPCYENLAPEVKAMLAEFKKFVRPPLGAETYREWRKMDRVMTERMKVPVPPEIEVENRAIAGPERAVPVRIYRPRGREGLPVILFCHGGGWVVGSLDMEEHLCLDLSRGTPSMVVSIDYGLAPEHPFPEGLEDCYSVLEWVAREGSRLGALPGKIGVCGESAGANLLAALALTAKDRGGPEIVFQVLLNPVTNLTSFDTQSHSEFGEGFFVSRSDMEGFLELYIPRTEDRSRAYGSPLLAPDLKGLPPALIITAGCDPLRDEGEAYARRLEAARVPVTYQCYDDMIHGFLHFFRTSGSAKKAMEEVLTTFRKAFGADSTV